MNVNYDRVCRLCLSSRGELLPIFPTTSSDDSEPPVLALKIKDCVSIQINENDDLPTNVCRKCMDNVNNWHVFKTVCERTQNKLQSLKDGSQLEEVKIKSEPLSDEAYDDGVVIDGSYPVIENAGLSNKVQPEGPPILASLGLTPRSDKTCVDPRMDWHRVHAILDMVQDNEVIDSLQKKEECDVLQHSDHDSDTEAELQQEIDDDFVDCKTGYICKNKKVIAKAPKLSTALNNARIKEAFKLGKHKQTAGKHCSRPKNAWQLLFTDDLLELIVASTNENIVANGRGFSESTTASEIKTLIGILYLHGIMRPTHPKCSDLWNSDCGVPCIRNVMKYERFKFLLQNISFDKKDGDSITQYDIMKRMRKVFEIFAMNCRTAHEIENIAVIDEIIVPVYGPCPFRYDIDKKPLKRGIKMVLLVDSSSFYVSNLDVITDSYFGAEEMVKKLVQHLAGTGRSIVMDSWFTSPSLIDNLRNEYQLYSIAALNPNSDMIPPLFLSQYRKCRTFMSGFVDHEVSLTSYVNTEGKSINVLTNLPKYYKKGHINHTTVVSVYKKNQSAVEVVDVLMHYYTTMQHTNDWTLSIFFTLLNIATVNAQVLWCSQNNHITQRRLFIKDLALSLFEQEDDRIFISPIGAESENNDEDEEETNEPEPAQTYPKVPHMPEVSITVMRPTGETLHARQGIHQLASKDCLVCGRSYRYSHNARRHELTAHSFDRYTNKITPKKTLTHLQPKLRPNPFNPKARMMPNPISHKMQFLNKNIPAKIMPANKVITPQKPIPIKTSKTTANNLPYPLRIKALKDLQIKKKEPQILKTLLTSKPEVLVSEPEILNSGPESPETLISEPEIASFQVEAILTEPDADAYDPQDVQQGDEEGDEDINNQSQNYDTVDMDSENEIEIARQQGMEQDGEDNGEGDDNIEHGDDDNNMEGGHSDNEKDGNDDTAESQENMEEEDSMDVKPETEGDMKDDDGQEDREHDDSEMNHNENEEEDDDDDLPMSLAPVVEINEGLQGNSFNSEVNEDDEELDETADPNETLDDEEAEPKVLDPDKTYVTKTQRDFIQKYRDIIQQINTKRCLCCDREHPRRKAVIQHLQKNGHKVPKHTCYNCVITFGHIGALLSHMRSNTCTNLWKIIYDENGISDDQVLEDEPKEVKVQYKDIFNARSYACKLCPAKFQLKQFIMKHVLDTHEDGQSRVPLTCVHCRIRFKDKSLLKKHIRKGDCTVYVACDLCSEKFVNMQDFNDHALAVHAGSFDQSDNQSKCVDGRPTDCPLCGKKNSSYPNLVKHLKIIHSEEKPHYCQHCDAKFEQATDLNKHIYMEHSDRTLGMVSEPDMSIVKEEAEEYHYSCTECNAIFETVDAWTDHQVAEHNQIAHHCDQCEKKFLRPSELAEHKNTHLRVKFYPCSVCPNSYGTPQKLSEHVQEAHAGLGPVVPTEAEFFCDICIRSFKSRQAYSNHMRIHAKVPTTNRKPGVVKGSAPQIVVKPIKQYPVAQPGFSWFKPNYNIPNAPYSCDICGKGFMHKKNIWKHKKVLHADILAERHDSEENTMQANSTEEEEFNPDENGAILSTPQFNSFNFTNFPNNVQQSNTETMPYSCELCFKRFPLKTSLWKHKRAKHGIVNPGSSGSNDNATTSASGGEGSSRSSCTICRITFSDKKSYYRHRKNVHKSTVQMCKICGKPLTSTLELYEHLKAAHARELLGYNANQGSSKSQDMTQEVEPDYENDQESADPSVDYQARYPCDTCGKQFVGLLALQNHQCINQLPAQPQTFDCEICHKSYTSISALKSHRGWHLRSPDGKAAANNSGLWMPQHKVTSKISKHEVIDPSQLAKVTHTSTPVSATAAKRRLPPEVEVTVVNPNKKLRSDDSVDMDTQNSGSLEDRYCTICDKEFTKRAAYQRHMDEVHQPNSVFCPVCDKSFTRKSTLLIHMKKHYESGEGSSSATGQGDDDMFSCDLCGAQYDSDQALRAHRARHHGEEEESAEESDDGNVPVPPPGEFTCAQCGDGVATPRDLIAHRTMHATPTKFFCNICKVYFARALDLSSHTRARHADNEKVFFPCAMCDRFYMNKKSLQRHIEMAH
ncbi:hypothetical protein SFRURICE_008935 [Spodoptera frugiperda]|uniref:SFRICE_004791 n=1 Tax=Spodoptera frugiperda TaxID=7108 RepID=A0A2H1VHF0_SPOFR|nr:hypothetical protein SFRURICE_008935 [Spodoptera frugiperda]